MNKTPLRIDKEGRWFYLGEEITHRKTYLLYSRSLARDRSGRIVLRVGREECPVEVEDAPYVVKTLTLDLGESGELNSLWLTLNDETTEPFDPETLRIGIGNIPYCRVKGRTFEARFSRGAYQLLIPYLRQDEPTGRFFLPLGGREYELLPPSSPLIPAFVDKESKPPE